ncbi:hypothetical protein AVEN_268989-1 [Araneus ventricosus]|uniref:Uncharacterized protein n=1 Tax=Araneus ventricosus TaxID=182803 RepID=A0A4Y2HJC8_ARAVE|nr:hypothetical protein AVEN_268989-1 [Araneus ventricosus]
MGEFFLYLGKNFMKFTVPKMSREGRAVTIWSRFWDNASTAKGPATSPGGSIGGHPLKKRLGFSLTEFVGSIFCFDTCILRGWK